MSHNDTSILQSAIQSVLVQLPSHYQDSFPPIEELLDPFLRYWSLLQRWNAKIKLTGASSLDEYATRHIADSLIGWWKIADASPGHHILDVGSGAGFPAIPLALLRPDLSWTLVESHSRRAAFLRQVKRDLKIQDMTIEASRVTGEPTREDLLEDYDAMVFRAVAPEQILPLAHRYLTEQGRVVYWGTPNFESPEVSTLSSPETLPYHLTSGEDFCLYAYTIQESADTIPTE